MPGLTVNVLLQDMTKLESDALIVGFHENVRPLKRLAGRLDWLLCGSLSNLILNRKIRGAVGEIALLTSRGKVPAQKIFMVGLGPADGAAPQALTDAARTAVSSAVSTGVRHVAVECFVYPLPYETGIPALLRGVSQGAGASGIQVSMIAPDAAAYDTISKVVKSTQTG
jgi:hypothetical protein